VYNAFEEEAQITQIIDPVHFSEILMSGGAECSDYEECVVNTTRSNASSQQFINGPC
jgi:hypothetical protein